MSQSCLRPNNQDSMEVEPEDRYSFNSLGGFYSHPGQPLAECEHLANENKAILFKYIFNMN